MPLILPPSLSLKPNSPTRNLIQPTADANAGLILRRSSSTITGAPLLQLEDETGALLTSFDPLGSLGIGIAPTSSYLLRTFDNWTRFGAVADVVAPTVTNVGTPGTTTYDYVIVAIDKNGRRTLASDDGTTTTGNATLSNTNYNHITWTGVTGAVSYEVVNDDAGTLVATTTATAADDKGGVQPNYTYPAHNATGDVIVDQSLVVGGTSADLDADNTQVEIKSRNTNVLVLRALSQLDVNFIKCFNFNGTVPFEVGSFIGVTCPGAGSQSERFGFVASAAGSTALAVGYSASAAGSGGTAVGATANAGGGNSIALGASASAAGLRSTVIGSSATDAGFADCILIGVGATATMDQQGVIGGPGAAALAAGLYFNMVTQASPVDIALNACGGLGANVAGAKMTIAGGQSTGSAKGGDVIVQTSPAGGAGSTQNPLVTLASFTGDSKFGIFSAATSPVAQQGATADLRQAFINYGWLATGGATPLDLNGGTFKTGVVSIKSSGEIDANNSAGTTGQVLTSQGTGAAAIWQTPSGGGGASLATLTDVSLSGTAQGDLLYRGASNWNNLVHGTVPQVLQTGGAAANPLWVTPGNGWPDFILTRSGAATPADPKYFTITPGADTALAASTEANDVLWSLNRTQQFATGALTNQRAVWIRKPTYGFVGASTITNAATVAIEGAPVAGTNATLTNDWALWVQADTSRFDGPVTCPGAGTSSERFGAGAVAAGNTATSLGNAASAAGLQSIAVGQGASASATNTTAIGYLSVASASAALAIGTGATCSASSSVSIGVTSSVTQGGVAIGNAASTTGSNGACFGASASCAGQNSLAVGGSASAAGADAEAIGAFSSAGHLGAICLGVVATSTASNQCVIGSSTVPTNDLYIGHGVGSSSPPAASLNASGGVGTNIAGANLTVAGGRSTGSAKGGDVLIRTSPAGGSGTSLNALSTLAQFTGDNKMGFFGATVVAQQTMGAATAGAVYTATEQTMLQSVYNAVRNLGFGT